MTESVKQRLQSALNAKSNASSNKMSKLEEDELFKKEYLAIKSQTLHTEHQSYSSTRVSRQSRMRCSRS